MSDSRRDFLRRSGLLGAGMLAGGGIVSAQHQGHIHPQPQPEKQPEKKATPQKKAAPVRKESAPRRAETPMESRPNMPVETPDVPKLPFTLDNGVKVFHLTAEVVK